MDFASGLIRDVVKGIEIIAKNVLKLSLSLPINFVSCWLINTLKGFSNILEICEPLILEKSMLLNQIPNDWLQQQVDAHCSSKRIPYVELISSVEKFQDQIFICDTGNHVFNDCIRSNICFAWFNFWLCLFLVAQTVSKLNINSGSVSSFQFSNLGILGFPYWSLPPLELVCAA